MALIMDYISILAGGACKFNCSFCIGNSIRENVTPHYSSKLKSFLECYANQTNLLSVSGDTSDPCFIQETDDIPVIAKKINSNIKVSIHTRNTDTRILEKYLICNYDKIVVSIDEKFFDNLCVEDILWYRRTAREKKLRFSIVLTSYNYKHFCKKDGIISKIVDIFPGAQITLRPNVFEEDCWIETFADDLGTWMNNTNGSKTLEENTNIVFWDYSKTNPNIDALYLFSDGTIDNNCKWKNIKENL